LLNVCAGPAWTATTSELMRLILPSRWLCSGNSMNRAVNHRAHSCVEEM
jgi:hypothetical protein